MTLENQSGICKVCGCSDELPCPMGCEWVNAEQTLCSSCHVLRELHRRVLQSLWRLNRLRPGIWIPKRQIAVRSGLAVYDVSPALVGLAAEGLVESHIRAGRVGHMTHAAYERWMIAEMS